MRVIVTGGTGLIGSKLVESLGQDGHEVYILSRNPRQDGPVPDTVHFVKYDAKTADGWAHLVDGADAIVNLAGENISGDGLLPDRWTPERKKTIKQSRIDVGKAIFEAVEQASTKPGVLIQASAVGYYGTHPYTDIVTEDHGPGDDFLAEVCQAWEASTEPVEAMGVRRCIIRTGIVLSNEGGALPPLMMPVKMFAGGPIGSGKQPFPWIHIDDEVRIIRYLIENEGHSGPFNLVAPQPPTNAQFVKAAASAVGRPAFVPTPGFVFELAFGEVAVLLTKGQNTPPIKLEQSDYTFKFTDAKAAVADLYA